MKRFTYVLLGIAVLCVVGFGPVRVEQDKHHSEKNKFLGDGTYIVSSYLDTLQ
jgi:hypothetical protein